MVHVNDLATRPGGKIAQGNWVDRCAHPRDVAVDKGEKANAGVRPAEPRRVVRAAVMNVRGEGIILAGPALGGVVAVAAVVGLIAVTRLPQMVGADMLFADKESVATPVGNLVDARIAGKVLDRN
jgi:hypothetical protein